MNKRSVAPSVAIVIAMISPVTLAQETETEVGRFQPPQASVGDQLGTSVAVDGDIIVVGAPYSDVVANNAGLAFVWEWSDVDWQLIGLIQPPTPLHAGDNFGTSVAVSGEWIAVGAPFDDDQGTTAGAVYIFHVSEGVITFTEKLYDDSPGGGNQFGASVAMDGSTLVVGSPQADVFNSNDGSATVFVLSGSSWGYETTVTSPMGLSGEYMGTSVDVSERCTQGTTLLVGAPGADGTGMVYVYYDDGASWQSGGIIESASPGPGYLFGHSVSIDGDTAAVGEPGSDEHFVNAGAAEVLNYIPGIGFTSIVQLEPTVIAGSNFMGWSVSVAGTDVLVGILQGEGGGLNTGRADLWEVSFGGGYTHSKIYEASDLTGTDVGGVGASVALSSRDAVVGAPYVDSTTGAAYIFSNQRYWLGVGGGDWIDSANWTGGRVPDSESAVYFGLSGVMSVEVGANNAEGDLITCFDGDITVRDGSGMGSLSAHGTSGIGVVIASNVGGGTTSLALESCDSFISGRTLVGGATEGDGLFAITGSTMQCESILVGTGGRGDMNISSSTTLNAEGVIQIGAFESIRSTGVATGSLRVEGGSEIALTSADGSSYDVDVQSGLLQIEIGSSITCDIGAVVHRGSVIQGDGTIAAPTFINKGRVISDVSSGTGLQIGGDYYQANENDSGDPINGLMVIEELDVGNTGIEASDSAHLDGGCVVDITDPDLLNVSDVLDILTAPIVGNQFSVWFVPAISDDKFLDTSYSLRGPGSGVSLIVQPLGATFGFNPATTGESGTGTPEAVVVDDFDGDLVDDVVIAAGGTGNSIDVWLNDGGGTLCLDSQVSLSNAPADLVAADFDQDGDLDLATVIPSTDQALVLLNNGTGVFSLGATLTTGNQPEGITAFSLNGDNLPDIAVTNYLDDTLTTYENTTTLMPLGFGSGSTVATVAKPKPVSPGGLGTGTDKDDDLVVGGEDGDVGGHNNDGLLNGIDAVVLYDPLGTPVDLAVLDLNDDGYDDIAVTLDGTDSLSVLINNTSTGFDSAVLNNAGAAGGTLLSSDIDDDGDDDLVLIEIDGTSGDSEIVALRNDSSSVSRGGSGLNNAAMLAESNLGPPPRGAGSDSGVLDAGDINVDGTTDIVQVIPVASEYRISVQTASSGSTWAPDACCVGDLDGSGDVGVDDLLALIGAWGACGNPSDCPEDLDGSGTVDVDDLLALIGVFGGC